MAGTMMEVFRDDFEGPTVDESKWNLVNASARVNGEQEFYIPEAISQDHSCLIIRSDRVNHGDKQFTSGRLDTRGKYSFTYGQVEWRAKLPKGKGIWPALWLLRPECPAAVEGPDGFWPPEIDVMEARGDQPTWITCAVHSGSTQSPVVTAVPQPIASHGDYTSDFHTFKMLWDQSQVVFYVDDVEEFTVTGDDKVPKDPLYLVMNVAVGGNYCGDPDDTTPFPTTFEIDYVSVSQLK